MSVTEEPIAELVATVRETLNEILKRMNALATRTLEAEDERNRLRVRLSLLDEQLKEKEQ